MFRGSKNAMQKRNRTRPARSRHLLHSALTAAALAAGFCATDFCPAAQAAGYVYQQHTLNAGVLVTGTGPLGAGPQIDPAPYLFYVLNNRPDVRPVDLNLVNPLAPAGILPSSAAYWEVSLNNVSDSQLAQYNVLYLPAGNVTFQPNVNEKLRRFVDNGGQLIVEYIKAPNAIGLFTGTGIASLSGTNVTFPPVGSLSLLQPIVSQPYLLSSSDLSVLSTSLSAMTSPAPYFLSANTGDSIHSGEFNSLFSPALVATSTGGNANPPPVVSAAQIGAGQVVASTLNIGGGISVDATYQNPTTNAYIFNLANLYAAPTPDLKLLANILTWSETHPNENKTSHGNASSSGLASFSPAWQYPVTTGTTPTVPPGAAVWGNFVFAVDANGVLHAFDAYPSENLTGGANTDDGLVDYSQGSSYDEIWNVPASSNSSVGPGASAPTVAARGNASSSSPTANYVFVEKRDGTVAAFNILDGSTPTAFTLTAPATGGTFPGTSNAPAPTIYDGRIYAGQANGTMHVYDLNEGTSAVVTLDPNTSAVGANPAMEPVTAAPSVGTLADGSTNVLIAVVPTTLNVYTVLLGGRNEPLVPFPANGTQSGYSISRLGRYDLSNLFADLGTAARPLYAYQFDGSSPITVNTSIPPPPASQDPLFAYTPTPGVTPPAYFTDWNMDFLNAGGTSTPMNPVNLNYISAASYSQSQSNTTPKPAAMSAPAIGRNGDYYYTETLTSAGATGGTTTNSYLVGVRNNPLYSRVQLKFRFRLPTTADAAKYASTVNGTSIPWDYKDADVNYNDTNYNNTGVNVSLVDYHFVGAPVVDDQDNVYVTAANGTSATVLCFHGDQQVSVSIPANSTADLMSDTIAQADENGGTEANTIQRGDGTETYGQFIGSPSSIQFYNFGKQGLTVRQIAGNVTEPQPLTATTTDGTSIATPLSMHTNLAWFVAPFSLTATTANGATTVSQISGLTQVGSSLLLTDGAALYRLSATPLVGTGRVVSTPPSVAPIGAGVVASAPSVGGSVLVINGTNMLAARTRQITVITDNNRILGVDGDGNAVWAVDATTRTDATQTPSVSTKVGFSHPTALSQFAVNDYLVADTGSNRCVRFDSAGNVRWELTRFQDPSGLLGAGQPLTLSQPASVVVRTVPDTATVGGTTSQANPGGSYVYYLVADSGNNRIVEVEDRVNAAGGIYVDPNGVIPSINHVLSWVTHTGDRDGRSYRYGSATYYPAQPNYTAGTITPTNLNIAATVTNTRLAPLTATGVGAVSGDAPGGSIVVFTYPQAVKPFSANAPSDLAYTTAGFYTASGTGTSTRYTPFTIRSPRFLAFYAPPASANAPAAGVPAFNFLYADDNGAFDLTYDGTKKAFIAGSVTGGNTIPDRLQFTTTNYQAMAQPAVGVAGIPQRTNLPFIPTCVQALSTDTLPIATGTSTVRRYLITQNYSQGELGTVTTNGKIGGEVFEVDVTYPPAVSGSPTVTTPGGFGVNSTLSHPALTGPLTQPTFAVRLP